MEHLIPRTLLRKQSKNDAGDFYACRRCNARKSHIDYVLGVVAKSQSRDAEFAAQTMITAVTRTDGRSRRFVQMLQTVEETSQRELTSASRSPVRSCWNIYSFLVRDSISESPV